MKPEKNKPVTTLVAAVFAALAVLVGASAGDIALAQSDAARPDGQIVFQSNRADGNQDVYVMNADSSNVRRLTFAPGFDGMPRWSPDGNRIAFVSDRDGNDEIYVMNVDGSGQTRVTTDPAGDFWPEWTSDGRIVFQRGPFNCPPCEGWITNADGSATRSLELGPGSELTPVPAPNGKRIAFASNRGDGIWRLYVGKLDGGPVKQVTDPGPVAFGDFQPRWSTQGNDLVFGRDVNGVDNDVYTVHADGSELQRVTSTPTRIEAHADWSAKGDRLIFGVFPGGGRARLHTIALDGFDERELPLQRAPVVDGFSDGIRDASIWHQVFDPGTTIVELDGRLEITIDGTAVPGGQFNQVAAHYGTQCTVPDDFAAEVDFELIQWPTPGGFNAGLNAIFADTGIWRHSAPWGDLTASWIAPVFVDRPLTASTGSFRIVREGGTTSTYIRAVGGAWTLVNEAPAAPGSAVMGLQLFSPAFEFQHLTGRVAFDNFTMSAEELACPSWWSAAAADWR